MTNPPPRPPSNAHTPSQESFPGSASGAWSSLQQSHEGRRELSPISTTFNQNRPSTASYDLTSRSPWSPLGSAVGVTSPTAASSGRQSARSPSITSPPGIAPPPGLSSGANRSRNIASISNPLQASAAAASSRPLGGAGSSGGSSSRNVRASPSLSQSSHTPTTPTLGYSSSISGQAGSGSVDKITTAQLFILLSQVKDERDASKLETAAERLKKVRSQAYWQCALHLLTTC